VVLCSCIVYECKSRRQNSRSSSPMAAESEFLLFRPGLMSPIVLILVTIVVCVQSWLAKGFPVIHVKDDDGT